MRSASRKERNSDAISRSCVKKRRFLGNQNFSGGKGGMGQKSQLITKFAFLALKFHFWCVLSVQPTLIFDHTCLNSFWKVCIGKQLQAIVSVIAVNIQFSSPNKVRRSDNTPGISSIMLGEKWFLVPVLSIWQSREVWKINENTENGQFLKDNAWIGVVRQHVNRSAGKSALDIGNCSPTAQAPSWMHV